MSHETKQARRNHSESFMGGKRRNHDHSVYVLMRGSTVYGSFDVF